MAEQVIEIQSEDIDSPVDQEEILIDLMDVKSRFPVKLWRAVTDGDSNVFRWCEDGRSFVVDQNVYEDLVLSRHPTLVRYNKSFANFRRLMREYGFHLKERDGPVFRFHHPCFLSGRQECLVGVMTRRIARKPHDMASPETDHPEAPSDQTTDGEEPTSAKAKRKRRRPTTSAQVTSQAELCDMGGHFYEYDRTGPQVCSESDHLNSPIVHEPNHTLQMNSGTEVQQGFTPVGGNQDKTNGSTGDGSVLPVCPTPWVLSPGAPFRPSMAGAGEQAIPSEITFSVSGQGSPVIKQEPDNFGKQGMVPCSGVESQSQTAAAPVSPSMYNPCGYGVTYNQLLQAVHNQFYSRFPMYNMYGAPFAQFPGFYPANMISNMNSLRTCAGHEYNPLGGVGFPMSTASTSTDAIGTDNNNQGHNGQPPMYNQGYTGFSGHPPQTYGIQTSMPGQGQGDSLTQASYPMEGSMQLSNNLLKPSESEMKSVQPGRATQTNSTRAAPARIFQVYSTPVSTSCSILSANPLSEAATSTQEMTSVGAMNNQCVTAEHTSMVEPINDATASDDTEETLSSEEQGDAEHHLWNNLPPSNHTGLSDDNIQQKLVINIPTAPPDHIVPKADDIEDSENSQDSIM